MHTWDLAKATDHDPTIDPDVATVVYDFWEPIPFDGPQLADSPKLASLAASTAATLVGTVLLRRTSSSRPATAPAE